MKAYELSKRLGYDITGKNLEITGVSYYEEALENEAAVVFNKSELKKTKAKVVITHPVLNPSSKTLIMTYEDLDKAIVKICDIFIEEGLFQKRTLPEQLQLTKSGYYVGAGSSISGSAVIYPGAVIGDNVYVGPNCTIEPFTVVGSGSILNSQVYIGAGCRISADAFFHYRDEGSLKHFEGCGRTVIGRGSRIGCSTIIQRGTISDTVIGEKCMIGSCVDIGHDVKIGDNCKVVSQTGIAGRAVLKNNVIVYGQVGISNNVIIGNNVIVKAKTRVSKPIADNSVIEGPWGRDCDDEYRLSVKIRRFFSGKV